MPKRAFSLLELSLVISVIGILVAGLSVGSGLLRSARLSNAAAHTAKSVVNDIDGLYAWYETTTKRSFNISEAINLGQITQWNDISPNSLSNTENNNLSTTASPNVTFIDSGINKLGSIKFSGSGNMSLSEFSHGKSIQKTIFFVFQPAILPSNPSTTTIDRMTLMDSSAPSHRQFIFLYDNDISLNAGVNRINPSLAIKPGENYILSAYFNESNSKIYLNDAQTMMGTFDPGNDELDGLTIASRKNSTSYFNGLISEIIIFDRPLKAQERIDVMSYLSQKYNINVLNLWVY